VNELQVTKPRPRPTPLSQPFWDALADGRLSIQRCDRCAALVFYPRLRCPSCASADLTWEDVEPVGRVVTVTSSRQPTAPPFADDVPQRIAIVELDAGPRITTTLIDLADVEPTVGMRVAGRFVTGSDGITMLHFAPAAS